MKALALLILFFVPLCFADVDVSLVVDKPTVVLGDWLHVSLVADGVATLTYVDVNLGFDNQAFGWLGGHDGDWVLEETWQPAVGQLEFEAWGLVPLDGATVLKTFEFIAWGLGEGLTFEFDPSQFPVLEGATIGTITGAVVNVIPEPSGICGLWLALAALLRRR